MNTGSLRHSPPRSPSGERPSGVPPPGKIGAARNELWAIVFAVLILLLIGFAFWFESTH